jgi:hypothetical protein
MISEHLHQLSAACTLHPGRPRLVSEEVEEEVVRFCLKTQHDRTPATFVDVIDFLQAKGVTVDRFWVRHFVQRQQKRLCIQKAKLLEKDRHDVSPDDVKRYFDILAGQITSIPSAFVWNADETRVGSPKQTAPPEVIVASNTKPESITIPEVRDDAQLTLLTAISAFGDSTYPLFISKLKTFEKTVLADQKLYEGHDYTIRSAPKTFITEVLFIDWLETIFLPRIAELRRKFAYDGPSILIIDGHATHGTPRVIAFCGARKVLLIKLVPHSSHLTQPLDLCVFGLFKIIYRKEKQSKGMKGETRKIYRALLAFYKSTIIPMIRWSFERAGLHLNPDDLMGPLTINPGPVLQRLEVPELSFDDAFVYPEQLGRQQAQGTPRHRRQPIPGPTEFAISLMAYVDATIGKCPLCGHKEDEGSSNEEESSDE